LLFAVSRWFTFGGQQICRFRTFSEEKRERIASAVLI